jgi:hypothetical protein
MSKKIMYTYNNTILDAQQIANMKYPKANIKTIQKLLRIMTVQEVLDYDIIKNAQIARRKGQQESIKINNTFSVGTNDKLWINTK